MMSASAGLLIDRIATRERPGVPLPWQRRCTASRRPPRSSATLSPIGLAQEAYWPAASALTGGPWSPASWKIAGTSGSPMNFS